MSQIQCQRAGQNKTVMHRSQETASKCHYCSRADGNNALSSRGISGFYFTDGSEPLPIDLNDESQFDPGEHSVEMHFHAHDLVDLNNPIERLTKSSISHEEFWKGDFNGKYETSKEDHPVSIKWADDEDFSDEDLKFLLAAGRNHDGELTVDDHFLEWAKENGFNSKDKWELSICTDYTDYYSRKPNTVLLEHTDEGAELIDHYDDVSLDRTKSVKLTDPTEYLSRIKGKTTRSGLLSGRELLDEDLKFEEQSVIDKFSRSKVTSVKAERLTMKQMKSVKILRPDDYANVQQFVKTEKAKNTSMGRNYRGRGKTVSGKLYHGVLIAARTVKATGRGDYEFYALDGYHNLELHLTNGNLRKHKEWLIYYTN